MRGCKTVLFTLIATLAIATTAEARRSYTIKPGDTPGEIAGKFAPSIEELRAANPKVNFTTLRVGDEIIDPRPEPADIQKAEGQIADLTAQLKVATSDLKTRTSELAASHGLNDTLDGKVAELEPLADMAESYRDQFWGWVGGLAVAFALALIDIAWQMRMRGKLDRKILDLQREVARTRADSITSVAASRTQAASRSARANGADTTTHQPH